MPIAFPSGTLEAQGKKTAGTQTLFEAYRGALKASPLPFLGEALDRIASSEALRTELEEILRLLSIAFPERPSPGWAASSTLSFNRMIIQEELDFQTRGSYRHKPQDAGRINARFYQSAQIMPGLYLPGLLLSYYTWRHHQELLAFYRETFLAPGGEPQEVMEWGPGHGLFSLLAARRWPNATLHVCDISPYSLLFTHSLLEAGGVLNRCRSALGDLLDSSLDLPKTDRLICAELLEHVAEPRILVQRVAASLKDGGKAFVTAAINAPQPDHIFHFRTESEVEDLIRWAGLRITGKRTLTHPHRLHQNEPPTVLALLATKEPAL
jgi:SAM-dependent methyltransferase